MRKELPLPIILLLVTLNCYPQELPITSQVDLLPDGHVTISVRNASAHPITALVAVAERIPLDKSVHGGGSVRFFDAITNFAHDRPLLRGDSTAFSFGGPSPGPLRVRYEVRCEAGILSDGTTFGDPTWANRLVSRRKYLYKHLESAIALLDSALQTGLSRTQVIERTRETEEARSGTAQDRFEWAAIGTLFGEIRTNLENNTLPDGSAVPDRERIQEVMNLLLKRRQLLLNSKPAVAE